MIDMKVEKLKKKIRKLKWHQKIELMDWLNRMYEEIRDVE